MSFSENTSTHHQVTGDRIPVAARAYWTQVAACHALRRLGARLCVPEGYDCCDFCIRSVPLDSFIREASSPICVCCLIEAALNPPEDEDDQKVRPAYAMQLLEESRFAEPFRNPSRRWSDVTEEDLVDPETGRIFGSHLVDRVTREEVDLAAPDGPRPCRDCNYVRILGWDTECEMCKEEMRQARLLGDALGSAAW